MILSIPKGTPTIVILNETAHIAVEYTITNKQPLQTKRTNEMKNENRMKDTTKPDQSAWRKMMYEMAKELHIKVKPL